MGKPGRAWGSLGELAQRRVVQLTYLPCAAHVGQGRRCVSGSAFWRFGPLSRRSRHRSKASFSSCAVFSCECLRMVSVCLRSSICVKRLRMRSMSESLPFWKSSHGGRCLKAVIAKLSDRMKATKGRPCLDAATFLLARFCFSRLLCRSRLLFFARACFFLLSLALSCFPRLSIMTHFCRQNFGILVGSSRRAVE